MLATRIIPTILSKNGLLVKGKGFKSDRVVGNALQAARIYAMRGVDELVIFDVTATAEGREPDYNMIRRLSEGCFAPLTVGGGVTRSEHVKELLRAGSDKISIGYRKGHLIRELSERYGRQCISVTIDAQYLNCHHAAVYALEAQTRGAGEIILQSIPRDGTQEGYDLNLIEKVANKVSIPVVASGGCSGYEDMYKAVKAGASAVAAGALFQYTASTPKGAAEYLADKGIEVRL